MASVGEIHRVLWMNIAGALCLAASVITMLSLHPGWQGPRAAVSIAIRPDATLRMSAILLSLHRTIVTWRGGRPIERAFQMMAITAPAFPFGMSTVRLDPDAGRSVGEVLVSDRGVFRSIGLIVITLGFIVVGRLRPSDRHD